MIISKETYDNLDIDYIKDRVNVFTPYGEVLKRGIQPLGPEHMQAIQKNYDDTEVAMRLIERHRHKFVELRNYFKHIKDLTGTFNRLTAEEVLSVTELFEVKSLAIMMHRIEALLNELYKYLPQDVLVNRLEDISKLLDPEDLKVNTFYLYDGYSEALKTIRSDMKAVDHLMSKIKKDQKETVESTHDVKVRLNGEIIVKKEEKIK